MVGFNGRVAGLANKLGSRTVAVPRSEVTNADGCDGYHAAGGYAVGKTW